MGSVMAIESRDPTTAGHSGRVASLTVSLAEATEQTPSGPFKDLAFSSEQIQEIRYASLLHDVEHSTQRLDRKSVV